MVRIITDSAADFELEEIKELGVKVVPLSVFFGEDEYQETVNNTKQEFYEKLIASDEIPHTSRPSPESFMNALQDAKDNSDETVVITLSSALSGTYQSALLAKNSLEYDECYVVDSLSATLGERLLVEYAVRLRDEGKNAAEIAAELENTRSRITIYACVDTLEYLHKGGRISHVSYAMGSLAKVKPIITVSTEGKVEIPAKVMGKNKAVKYLCGKIQEVEPDTNHPVYAIYSNDRENVNVLIEATEVKVDKAINLGSVIGTHVGPNAFGFIYIAK